MLSNEILYLLSLILEENCIEILNFNLEQGNHPVYNDISTFKLKEFVKDELLQGLTIPILSNKVSSIL